MIGTERISKDMVLGELLKLDIRMADVLFESGMHCLGCPSAQVETLEDACSVHGISVDKILEKLNKL